MPPLPGEKDIIIVSRGANPPYRLQAPLRIPSRYLHGGHHHGGVSKIPEPYEAYRVSELDYILAMEEIAIKKGFGDDHAGYLNSLLERSPVTVWKDNFFLDGVVYEKTRAKDSEYVTSASFKSGGREFTGAPGAQSSSEGIVNVINYGMAVMRNLIPDERGTTTGSLIALVFKRVKLTGPQEYRFCPDNQEMMANHRDGTRQLPLAPNESIYALQLLPVAYPPGRYLPMDYLTYTIEVGAGAAARTIQCHDGLSIKLGHVYHPPQMTRQSQNPDALWNGLRPDEIRPHMDDYAMQGKQPIPFFVSLYLVDN